MAVERKPRNPMPVQDAKTRAHNFEEVALGYDLATAKAEAERCLNCKAAPCMHGCPVSVRIPEFLKAVREGDIEKAGHIIKSTNSLPSVCGRVCPQENQCEKLCVRGRMEGPVAIGSVERFVGDYMLNVKSEPAAAPTGKKVAVIGSGPAGLTWRRRTGVCRRGSHRVRGVPPSGRRARVRYTRIPSAQASRRRRNR